MPVQSEAEPPPDPGDLEGWRRAVRDGHHSCFPMEAVIAAIQDLGPNSDREVINVLALHASDTILRILRSLVGKNHSNQGADIVDDVHGQMIEAVLRPDSADGKGLREAFIPRLRFRVADAIRADVRKRARECVVGDLDGAFDPKRADDTSLAREIESRQYVEDVLSHITDDRKRLAFRLHMEGVPIHSKRTTTSIAGTLAVSSKTAGLWIEEVQARLREIVGEQS
jgi:hypothetical protein